MSLTANMETHLEHLLSISELAGRLNVSSAAVTKWIGAGLIPAPALEGGGARLFTEAEARAITRTITKRRSRRLKAQQEP